MWIPSLLLVLALGLLFLGAESLVRGSASVARRFGVSPLIVGLTIVAFGTSSPELVVSLKASIAGQGDISLGNVLGSNSFNVGIILGLTALICPIPVHLQIVRFDAPIALFAALLLPVFLWDGGLSRWEGGTLFGALVAYLIINVRTARKSGTIPDELENIQNPSRHGFLDAVMIVAGLALLVLGSTLLVDNAVVLARSFGVSDAIIGLTIVAAGTSMPELATSLIAAFRRQPDIAIGNVVGSNIFNIFGILGITGLVAPIAGSAIRPLDFLMVIIFSVLLIPLIYTGRRLIRAEGGLLLLLYAGYLWFLWPR